MFRGALASARRERLSRLFSDVITLAADGGGRVAAIPHTLRGRSNVLAFVMDALRGHWSRYAWQSAEINGARGILLVSDDRLAAAVTLDFDASGRIAGIFIMRNPDKLAGLEAGGPEIS